MPIYEYRCKSCKKVSSFLLLRTSEDVDPYCKSCGSKDVKRQISSVALPVGEEKIMERLIGTAALSDIDENDPSSIERAMKRVGRGLGDELGGDFEETVGRALNGEGAIPGEGL